MKNMKKGTTPIVIAYVIGIIITILILIAIRYGEYLLIADSLPGFFRFGNSYGISEEGDYIGS